VAEFQRNAEREFRARAAEYFADPRAVASKMGALSLSNPSGLSAPSSSSGDHASPDSGGVSAALEMWRFSSLAGALDCPVVAVDCDMLRRSLAADPREQKAVKSGKHGNPYLRSGSVRPWARRVHRHAPKNVPGLSVGPRSLFDGEAERWCLRAFFQPLWAELGYFAKPPSRLRAGRAPQGRGVAAGADDGQALEPRHKLRVIETGLGSHWSKVQERSLINFADADFSTIFTPGAHLVSAVGWPDFRPVLHVELFAPPGETREKNELVPELLSENTFPNLQRLTIAGRSRVFEELSASGRALSELTLIAPRVLPIPFPPGITIHHLRVRDYPFAQDVVAELLSNIGGLRVAEVRFRGWPAVQAKTSTVTNATLESVRTTCTSTSVEPKHIVFTSCPKLERVRVASAAKFESCPKLREVSVVIAAWQVSHQFPRPLEFDESSAASVETLHIESHALRQSPIDLKLGIFSRLRSLSLGCEMRLSLQPLADALVVDDLVPCLEHLRLGSDATLAGPFPSAVQFARLKHLSIAGDGGLAGCARFVDGDQNCEKLALQKFDVRVPASVSEKLVALPMALLRRASEVIRRATVPHFVWPANEVVPSAVQDYVTFAELARLSFDRCTMETPATVKSCRFPRLTRVTFSTHDEELIKQTVTAILGSAPIVEQIIVGGAGFRDTIVLRKAGREQPVVLRGIFLPPDQSSWIEGLDELGYSCAR
jgi:hypothetical protein